MSDKTPHILTVDAARGLLALGVMLYHLLSYLRVADVPQLGTYGVYAFFAISGFSLYIAYRDRLGSAEAIRAYFVRRYFRIAPLFYTALLFHLWLVSVPSIGWYGLILNVTFFFGAMNPAEVSIITGGWSIGVEMVFYVIFPVLIALAGGRIERLAAIVLLSLMAQFMFVNHTLQGVGFDAGWVAYTQPVAFLGYFAAGCLVAEVYLRRPGAKGRAAWFIVAPSIMAFALAPLNYDTIMTGWLGAALTLCALTLVTGVAFLPEPTGLLRSVAIWLGRVSYPAYLLHPIVFNKLGDVFGTVIITILLSEVITRFIEEPARRFGRSLTKPT